jgi:hypothetical protein
MSNPLRGPSTKRLVFGVLFVCALFAGSFNRMHAQTTVTVGTGTVTSYQVPMNLYYMNSICEAVYTATDITGGGWGGGAGVITNFRLHLSAANTYTPQAGATVSIYLENTLDATMPIVARPGYTGGTLVWTGTHPLFNLTGWWNFTLTAPFCYDGGNLYVRIVRNDTNYGSTTPVWTNTNTTNYQCRYDYWDSTPFNTNMIQTYTRPNIQMVIGAGAAQTYVSSTTTQNNTTPTGNGQLNQEIIGMQVVTSGCTSPLSTTSFTFNTAGSTSASDITNAKVYYTASSSAFAAVNQFGSAVANPNGSFTVTGTRTLSAGNNYFWLAYDVSPTAVSGNVVDAQCNSITVGGIARTPTVTNPTGSRTILASFSGIYTIDPNGSGSRNFINFTNAINAMLAAGVSGPTTFQVAASTYGEQLTIPSIPGVSATNTVTFDGGTGNAASRIISFSVNAAYASVITMNGADYLKFKNLTVNSTNASYGYCFLFTNPTGSNPSEYNEISNCVLNVPANTTSSYHIPLVASNTTSYSSYGNWANYNLFQNNTLNSGYFGVSWMGQSSSLTQNVGNEFIGNTIQNWYYYGMYMWYSSAVKINKNRIVQRTTGTYTTTGGYGIYHYYPYNGPQFIGNYVWSAYAPLFIVYANQMRSNTTVRGKCINNMLIGNGTSTVYGLYFDYPQYSDIGFNSIYTKTTSTAYGFYNYGASSSYDNKVANNYIVNEGTNTWYPMYHYYTTDMSSQYDRNAYFRLGASGTNSFYWNGTTYASLAALQSGTTTVHDWSVWGNPYFISATDLHSRSHVGYQAGIPFAGVTDDFDGDLRSATVPSIGADEYPAPPNEFDMALTAVRFENAASKFAHLEDPATHQVKVTVQNIGLSPNPTSLPVVYKLGSMPTNSTDGVAQTFTPSWDANRKAMLTFTQPITGLTVGTTETVYARVFFPGEEDESTDTRYNTHEIFGSKVHGAEDFEDMVPMALPLTYDVGYLPSQWQAIDNNGGSSMKVYNGMFNGTNQAFAYDAPDAANEWLVSPGAFLIAGSSYRVGFEFRNWTGGPVTIECAFGASPNPATMTTYATFSNIAPGTFLTAKQLAGGIDPYFNTPNFHQPYYLGFRFITPAGYSAFSIDKIKLDDNPSPPPKIAYGLPGDPIDNFVDDPAVPIIMVATYKAPGVINKTFAVANKINIYGAAGDFLWDAETSTPWLSITKAIPDPTLQGYNLTPPRPRQFQTFTLTADPAGLSAGVHHGAITLYGILFNNDFPPPANGLIATNEPMIVPVELRIITAGSKGGATSMVATIPGPLTVPGSPYHFRDPITGDPIATLHVTSGQIDQMTIRCFPNQLPQNLARLLYVQRYWQISHTGTGWTADLTLPYADHEAAMVMDRYQLRGVRQAVPLAQWENPIMGTSSVSYPLTNQVRVSNFNPSNIGGNIALAHPYMIATKDGSASAESFGMEQNYPNPFNPTTTISFAVAEERSVRIAVYNSLGIEVAELVNEVLPAGRFEATFDATNLPSGTYVYRMTAGDFVQTRQMTLSK